MINQATAALREACCVPTLAALAFMAAAGALAGGVNLSLFSVSNAIEVLLRTRPFDSLGALARISR